MSFKQFKMVFRQHANSLFEHQALFVAGVDGDELWELYLNSFPPGTNEIYRERRSHDCSCCRHFIRQFGAVVAIVDNQVVSIWDFDAQSDVYQPVVDALAARIKAAPIRDLFVTKESGYGTDKNHERREDYIHTWHHFRVDLPSRLVSRSHKTVGALMGEARASKDVFKRSLDEISRDALDTVMDLIVEESLYRGQEWYSTLGEFREMHHYYHNLPAEQCDNYCWAKSVRVGGAMARIRNHSIGVLLQDLTSGMDVMEAVGRYENIVAPSNYKRPKPIFTQSMVKDAQATVERLGILDSLPRRYAVLDDITINDVLWANRDAVRQMEGLGIFEELAEEVTIDPQSFERLPGAGVGDVIASLSDAGKVELFLENRHEGKLVSLIAPVNKDAPPLFKWGNNFGWAYSGNLTDSMRERVKALGGDVTGVLRFSIQWNEDRDNPNDFDAHCMEPTRNHIYFHNKGRRHPSSGVLDVDIIHPGQRTAVENITWSNMQTMPTGIYHFYVRNYSHNGGRSGFRAEIEFGGRIYEYDYPHELCQSEEVTVAKIRHTGGGSFEFVSSMPTTSSSKEMWGLMTNRFHPVSAITYSPNYWGDSGIGNRHYFFMLAGCINPERPSGFFNEYLRQDLLEQKRVFAALGNKMRVEQIDAQLSGVGFSSTIRASFVLRIDGKPVKVVV